MTSFEAGDVWFELLSKKETANILAPGPKTKKSKQTLLFQTLKVEEQKVSLVFLFVAQKLRYGHCLIFHVFPFDKKDPIWVMATEGLINSFFQ